MVLNKNGSHTIDPIGCDYETCPAISKEIDNNPVIITSAVFYWLLYPRSWKWLMFTNRRFRLLAFHSFQVLVLFTIYRASSKDCLCLKFWEHSSCILNLFRTCSFFSISWWGYSLAMKSTFHSFWVYSYKYHQNFWCHTGSLGFFIIGEVIFASAQSLSSGTYESPIYKPLCQRSK